MTTTPIALTRANTILYCQNWEETVHFYRQLLCFPVAFENDWFVEFHLVGSNYLSIAQAARATIAAVAGQGVTLTWQVEDLEGVERFLHSQGIATTPIRRKWNARVLYCYDPEGHRLEFWANHIGQSAAPEEGVRRRSRPAQPDSSGFGCQPGDSSPGG